VQEVLDLGFDELMDGSWVVFVEWGDVIDTLLPPGHLRVALSAGADDARSIDLSGEGPEWARRWGPLEAALGEWRAA
jgi:tRNA A37 threonylcarbamoyladenosine biosynthesis protein TsaE